MRCLYCHDRDTWDMRTDRSARIECSEVMKQVISYRHYLARHRRRRNRYRRRAFAAIRFSAIGLWPAKPTISTPVSTPNGYALHYDHILDDLLDHADLVMLDLKQV